MVICCSVIGWDTIIAELSQSPHQRKENANKMFTEYSYNRKSMDILIFTWYFDKAQVECVSILSWTFFLYRYKYSVDQQRPTYLHTNDLFDHVLEGSGLARTLRANDVSDIPMTSLDIRCRVAISNSPNMVPSSGKKRKASLINYLVNNSKSKQSLEINNTEK